MPTRKPAKSGEQKASRKMPAFTKPSPATVEAFERATRDIPGVEHRSMFGYPSAFLNGNMLASIFQDRVMLRLSEADRREAIARAGAKPFEPSPGRAMKEYVEFPPGLVADTQTLDGWLARGRAYVAALPKKVAKKRR